jgi:hypothetical protein
MTQKSEQRNPAEKFFSESPRGPFLRLAFDFDDQQRDVIFDFAVAYAKSVTLKLAEEAEQQAGEIQNYQEWTWSNVAAWLREKAS